MCEACENVINCVYIPFKSYCDTRCTTQNVFILISQLQYNYIGELGITSVRDGFTERL